MEDPSFKELENSQSPPSENGSKPTVVGIGASAGGLAALKRFFELVPSDSGLVFVVVVHLSPEHKSHMVDLLQPSVRFPVRQVTETIPLEPNNVYVIPPNANLSAIDTHLRLSKLEEQRRERAPIDHFFRTLAATHDGHAIGIILTGTGSDGTLGLKEIKAKGGLILVQDPNDAEFDGMPQSAIATGQVDRILPIAEMREVLLRLAEVGPRITFTDEGRHEPVPTERLVLPRILAVLKARTERDFSRYKPATILRRIARRMQLNYIEDIQRYLEKLREQPDEARALSDDLLITVTSFFRDAEVFEKLEKDIVPKLFDDKGPNDNLRVWTVGCATGEEAYSVAMLLLEQAARHTDPPKIQIFASDLHKRSLEGAREGLYPGDIETDVSSERLNRFFQRENGGFRICKEVRDTVVFAPHNLLGDPPFSRLDLITCRNLLIYLDRSVQHDVVDLFHYALCPRGYLLLGSAEIVDASDLFRTEDKKLCLYQKRNVLGPEPRLPVFPITRLSVTDEPSLKSENGSRGLRYHSLHQDLLERYAPPSILVSPDNQLAHLSEHAGRYLNHPGGEVTSNVLRLVREELRVELQTLLQSVREKKELLDSEPVNVRFNGHSAPVVMHVRPALDPHQDGFVLVIFDERAQLTGGDTAEPSDVAIAAGQEGKHLAELETELNIARQRLQTLVEEYETTQEEMKASNEEMQSTNEELRSTMEELETSKEELQSINEELQTVNQENRHKVEELSQLSSDLQNLLAATDIATLFLDRDLRIMRFTPRLAELFNVRITDRGRPISDLTHRLGYERLREDAKSVLERLIPVEREIRDDNGQWYLTRILPYRSTDDRIEGLVITLVEITSRKLAEAALSESEQSFRALVTATSYSVYRMSPDWSEMRELEGQGFLPDLDQPTTSWLEHYIYPEDQPRVLAAIREAIGTKSLFELEHRVRRFDGGLAWAWSRAVPLLDSHGIVREWFGAATDVTARRQAEMAFRQSEERFRLFVENVQEYALVQTDSEGTITNWNPGAQRLFGYDSEQMLGKNFGVLLTEQDQADEVFAKELTVIAAGQRSEDARWFVRQNGSRFWARWISEPIIDEAGQFRGVAKIMRDETERQRSTDAIQHSLVEKEELLKEVHHRVKNNLQVIISLLNMQAAQIADRPVLALFQETRNRVLAISSIHELLYRSESFARISLADYAGRLASDLVRFYGLEQRVRIDIAGDGATLEMERAVPYGMLLNELVSNACKHAFPPPQSGVITVGIFPANENKELVLTVSDTGQGLPEGFNFRKASSLGLKLVHGLVRQLRGTMAIQSGPGTTVTVRFPAMNEETPPPGAGRQ